jgi:hypothetical protein
MRFSPRRCAAATRPGARGPDVVLGATTSVTSSAPQVVASAFFRARTSIDGSAKRVFRGVQSCD